MTSFGFVGDLLERKGLVDVAGLTRAMEARAVDKATTLGRALATLNLVDESLVASTIAAALHLEYLDGALPEIAADVAALFPAEFSRKRGVVPLTLETNSLRLAVCDPMDDSVLQDARFRTGKNIKPVVVSQTWLDELCARTYPEAKPVASAYDMLPDKDPSGELESSTEGDYYLLDAADSARNTNLAPVIRLVNLILSDAATAGASDIHVEPQEDCVQVRQRVDGLLRDVLTLPHHMQDQTISRLKIISGMDIAERRKPQDGRSRLRFEGRRIDLRVSTLPTQFGEKVVIRLLNSDRAIVPFDQIDFSPDNLRIMRTFLSRPQGMILVTGPTGSGKTSTLYTALNSIRSSTNNIVTLEDPIEFQLPGVNQMQINTRAGVTFASGLRSILRQDPNVILVGEIRDQETAEIALQASQTGHLLLSTVHTNDAPATITRLFDLGIPPFLVASSLIGILAQRLVRRPCPSCASPARPSDATIAKVGGLSRLPSDAQWVAAPGCEKCAGSGVKGRLAIHEVLEINEEVRDLIARQASEQAIRAAGKRAGMRTLFEDGLVKAAQGLTTLDELLRVVSPDEPVEATGSARWDAETAPINAAATAAVSAPPLGNSSTPAGVGDPAQAAVRQLVLVVDDSPTTSSVVKYFLELEGFEVVVAANGQAGLETARRVHPRMIVSDVNMPGMGGVAMVKALRADPLNADVRILMLTSESSVEAESEGLGAGADDYILKPVEPRRLAARVKALLARSGSRAA